MATSNRIEALAYDARYPLGPLLESDTFYSRGGRRPLAQEPKGGLKGAPCRGRQLVVRSARLHSVGCWHISAKGSCIIFHVYPESTSEYPSAYAKGIVMIYPLGKFTALLKIEGSKGTPILSILKLSCFKFACGCHPCYPPQCVIRIYTMENNLSRKKLKKS